MLKRDDFKICKEGRGYKVVRVMFLQHPFSPGAPPETIEIFIESGLTRIQAERRIYEYIIEQMKIEYKNHIRTLTERKDKVSK